MLDAGQKEEIRNLITDTLLNYADVFRVKSGYIQSGNFITGTSGWQLNAQGNLEANNGVFRGSITGASGTFSGSITGATGTFSGSITGATGAFAGTVAAGNITAGAIVGSSVESSSGGGRVVLSNGDSLDFYYGGTLKASITGNSSGINLGGYVTLSQSYIYGKMIPGSDNTYDIGGSPLGDGSFKGMYCYTLYQASDKRLKKNIKQIESALDKVNKLQGVSFKWKKGNKKEIGLIAQDVKKVLPEVVNGSDKKGYSINYGNITALLIEAIKEQQTQIDELKRQ